MFWGSEFLNSDVGYDTKLCGGVDMPGWQDAIQRGIGRLEKWVQENLMKSNKTKEKILHLENVSPCYQYKLENERIENSPS